MGEKKKPGRFTLQFNLEDPQQQTVSELLEQQGRHKAQFITSAVLHYIQHPGQSSGHPPVDEASLEQMILAIMEKHPQFSVLPPNKSPKTGEVPAQIPQTLHMDNRSIGSDAIAAISETLAAFQQG